MSLRAGRASVEGGGSEEAAGNALVTVLDGSDLNAPHARSPIAASSA